LFLP